MGIIDVTCVQTNVVHPHRSVLSSLFQERVRVMLARFAESLLSRYLGEYVENISIDHLRVGVATGDVSLTNLSLKPDALYLALNLPLSVKCGIL